MRLTDMLNHIDAKAGAVRACYITVAPGQEVTYILKAAQAKAYSLAGFAGPVPGLLQAEMTATGQTVEVVVARILGEEAQWAKLAAVIESLRRSAKQALTSTQLSDAEKQAIYESTIVQFAEMMPQ